MDNSREDLPELRRRRFYRSGVYEELPPAAPVPLPPVFAPVRPAAGSYSSLFRTDHLPSSPPPPAVICTDRLPLLWIDMKLAGDKLLEIACVITDKDLNVQSEMPAVVINQPREYIDQMCPDLKKNYTESGLIDDVKKSDFSIKDAEDQICQFLTDYIKVGPLKDRMLLQLAGDSAYTAYHFIKANMRTLFPRISHRVGDVTSVTSLSQRWFPQVYQQEPSRPVCNRALEDVKASIASLKYYRENVFKV